MRMQVVLQLMKLARQKDLLRFFQWLVRFSAKNLPESLLRMMLLYALHSDSDLDVEKIYLSHSSNPEFKRNTMSVAEKLIAQGRVEGLWIGKIQAFEEFLEKPQTLRKALEVMPISELMALHQDLHHEYEVRFKRL